MSARLSDLERLKEMLNDELISREEFLKLKAEVLSETPEPAETAEQGSRVSKSTSDRVTSGGSKGPKHPNLGSSLYRIAFGLGIASIFLGGFFGLLAWATVGISVWALYTLNDPNRRWMAWTGLALGIVFSFFNAYQNGHLDSLFTEDDSASASLSSSSSSTFVDGITLAEFERNWQDVLAVIEPNESEKWALEAKDTSPTSFELRLSGLTGPTFVRGSLSGEGHMENVGVHTLYAPDGEEGHAAETNEFLTAWEILCYTLDGRGTSTECAQEVGDGMGYSFQVLEDWDRYHEPIVPGGDSIRAEYVRDGVHWELLVSYGGISVSASLGTTAMPEPTTIARTTTYPENLIVDEIQDYSSSVLGFEVSTDSATTLASVRSICPDIDQREAAGEANPVLSLWLAIENEVPEVGFRKIAAFEIDEAVVHYCPEYQTLWSGVKAELGELLG